MKNSKDPTLPILYTAYCDVSMYGSETWTQNKIRRKRSANLRKNYLEKSVRSIFGHLRRRVDNEKRRRD